MFVLRIFKGKIITYCNDCKFISFENGGFPNDIHFKILCNLETKSVLRISIGSSGHDKKFGYCILMESCLWLFFHKIYWIYTTPHYIPFHRNPLKLDEKFTISSSRHYDQTIKTNKIYTKIFDFLFDLNPLKVTIYLRHY